MAPGQVVTVSVPPSEAHRLALLFDPNVFNGRGLFRLWEGERAVTFRACKGSEGTQFAGGFIVVRAQCDVLDVQQKGRPTRHLTIRFAKRTCP